MSTTFERCRGNTLESILVFTKKLTVFERLRSYLPYLKLFAQKEISLRWLCLEHLGDIFWYLKSQRAAGELPRRLLPKSEATVNYIQYLN